MAGAALQVLDPGSAIVFIGSAASLRAATGIPAYDASKAALPGICRQVAREGMARGIRANLVVPSLVDTPLGREASRLNPGRTERSLPFGRQATAWEVAYATVWLLSEESSYVNAHPLVLDGGATSFGLPPWLVWLLHARRLGGTITGEHGVGVLKRAWLREQLGPASLAVHQAIKTALDPVGILNRGRSF